MGMTDAKILQAAAGCSMLVWQRHPRAIPKKQSDQYPDGSSVAVSAHLLYMADQIGVFLREGRREKVMRWLGFMQGVLYCDGYASLDQLKKMNMPDELPGDPDG